MCEVTSGPNLPEPIKEVSSPWSLIFIIIFSFIVLMREIMKLSEFSHQVALVRCFVFSVVFVVLNFASQISIQPGLVLTLETCGISVRSAVIVCVLYVRLLMQSIGVKFTQQQMRFY